MSCNPAINRVPRGNDFYLAVKLKSVSYDGDTRVTTPFDFTTCDSYTACAYAPGIGKNDIISSFVGIKEQTSDTLIIDVHNAPLHSLIVIEAKGTMNGGRAFRAAERGYLSIVEYNDQASVVFAPVTGAEDSNIEMTLQFLPSAAVVGKNSYDIWREQPGNEGKTIDDYVEFLGHGESAYEIAVRYGYIGTEEEYNDLYFDAVAAATGAAATANAAAGAANEAAEMVEERIDDIDEQMSHLCYHDVDDGTVEPADFDPEADTVHVTQQTLSSAQKQQARTNIGAGTSSFSGSYNDLTDKPTIPDAVSGTDDGTNWTSITIGSTTKAIPSGGGGGEANVIESISINGTTQTVTSKNVDLPVPTSTAVTQIVSISQSAYDALATKDSSTLYLITS